MGWPSYGLRIFVWPFYLWAANCNRHQAVSSDQQASSFFRYLAPAHLCSSLSLSLSLALCSFDSDCVSKTKKIIFLIYFLLITQNHIVLYTKFKQKQNMLPSRHSSQPLYASLVHQLSLLGYVLFDLYFSLSLFWFKPTDYFVYLKTEFSLRVISFNFS